MIGIQTQAAVFEGWNTQTNHFAMLDHTYRKVS